MIITIMLLVMIMTMVVKIMMMILPLMMSSWPAAHFAAGDREVESLLLGITLTLYITSHSHCC